MFHAKCAQEVQTVQIHCPRVGLSVLDRSRIRENSGFSAARPKSHDFGYRSDSTAGSIFGTEANKSKSIAYQRVRRSRSRTKHQ